jgi:hypothetical protein
VNVRSTSNVATGSARDRQYRQRSSVASPLTSREQLCSETTPPAGHGRRPALLHRAAAARKTAALLHGRTPRQLASRYDERSARYPAGAPGLKQSGNFEGPNFTGLLRKECMWLSLRISTSRTVLNKNSTMKMQLTSTPPILYLGTKIEISVQFYLQRYGPFCPLGTGPQSRSRSDVIVKKFPYFCHDLFSGGSL